MCLQTSLASSSSPNANKQNTAQFFPATLSLLFFDSFRAVVKLFHPAITFPFFNSKTPRFPYTIKIQKRHKILKTTEQISSSFFFYVSSSCL